MEVRACRTTTSKVTNKLGINITTDMLNNLQNSQAPKRHNLKKQIETHQNQKDKTPSYSKNNNNRTQQVVSNATRGTSSSAGGIFRNQSESLRRGWPAVC